MFRSMLPLASSFIILALAASCTEPEVEYDDRESQREPEDFQTVKLEEADRAIAVLHPTVHGTPALRGTVEFTRTGDGVRVVAHVEGLPPGSVHAIHIHEYGDCSAPDAMSAGEHYNPEGHPHALPTQPRRHAGDLGNLEADDQGKAHLDMTVDNLSIAGEKSPILGRAVIIHSERDKGTQPSGDAGSRMACGVIGIPGPESP